MIKIIIKHTKPTPTFVERNDYLNHLISDRNVKIKCFRYQTKSNNHINI